MNEKFGIGFALAFPVLALGLPGDGDGDREDGHLSLRKSSYQWSSIKQSGQRRILAAVETAGAVPMNGNAAFGYAWLSDGGNNVLVLASHSPLEGATRAAGGFRTHVLDLKEPTPACAGASYEVDLENSRRNPAYATEYAWKVRGTRLAVQDVPAADLGDTGIESVAAFTLKPVPGRAGEPGHLCLTVVDQL